MTHSRSADLRCKPRILHHKKRWKPTSVWCPFCVGVILGVVLCLRLTYTNVKPSELTTTTFHPNNQITTTTSVGPLLQESRPEIRARKQIYVGVMTTAVFLDSRALSIYRTWGQDADNIEYFTARLNGVSDPELPVVLLKGVSDSQYPPVKKSVRMLSYMCSHHINDFHWFVRADDDLYIKMERLQEFLNKLEKGRMMYVGQGGEGVHKERPHLKLDGYNYCMGGPGIVLSRNLLQALCPYLPRCARETISSHEDVELGRCIQRHLGVRCATSYKLRDLFFHAYEELYPKQEPFISELDKDPHISRAITIHYAKKPEAMFNLRHQHLNQMISKATENIERYETRLEHLKAIQE